MSKRFVYILRSLVCRKRRYVGLTSDVDRRLAEHNAGLSSFTSKYRPWAVTVRIEFSEEHRAIAFERYLKSPSGRAIAKRHFAFDGSLYPPDESRAGSVARKD
jgi:putative endonuclease